MMSGPLPPQPDVTGHPRPPAAPQVAGRWEGHSRSSQHHDPEHHYGVDHSVGPPGQTLLESVRSRRPHPWRYARDVPFSLGILVLPMWLVLDWLSGASARDYAAHLIVIAACLLAFYVVRYLQTRNQEIVAGTRWVGIVDEDRCVRTYELVRVEVAAMTTSMVLRLSDPQEGMEFTLGLLQGNPQLWDLVYNGIRYSVAAGAEIDDTSRRLLKLPVA
jgi:hypothetical protein